MKSMYPHYVFDDKNHQINEGQTNQSMKFRVICIFPMTITNITWSLWLVLQVNTLALY